MIDFLNYVLIGSSFKVVNLLCIVGIIVLWYNWWKLRELELKDIKIKARKWEIISPNLLKTRDEYTSLIFELDSPTYKEWKAERERLEKQHKGE